MREKNPPGPVPERLKLTGSWKRVIKKLMGKKRPVVPSWPEPEPKKKEPEDESTDS